MAALTLHGVSKRYGDVTAVDNLDLAVRDGEFFVLLGPSGCGKSTVLRMLLGLEMPSAGALAIDGEDVTAMAPGDRDLAAVFQSDSLYRYMTVYENIAFPLVAGGTDKQTVREKVRDTAELLGIAALLDRTPQELSGGECRRVAIARALVCEPRAFLMDEPLTGLDAELREQLRGELARLHRRTGATFLYVTHDQTEAMALGDRIAVMRDGRLVQIGMPLEVYRAPADTFVARFLGSPGMNLLPATLVNDKGGCAVEISGYRIPLGEERSARLAEMGPLPRRITAGVRPERVKLSKNGAGLSACAVQAEPTGAHVVWQLEGEGWRGCALLPPEKPVTVGERIVAAFLPEDVCLFDEDGQNMERRE